MLTEAPVVSLSGRRGEEISCREKIELWAEAQSEGNLVEKPQSTEASINNTITGPPKEGEIKRVMGLTKRSCNGRGCGGIETGRPYCYPGEGNYCGGACLWGTKRSGCHNHFYGRERFKKGRVGGVRVVRREEDRNR